MNRLSVPSNETEIADLKKEAKENKRSLAQWCRIIFEEGKKAMSDKQDRRKM